MRRVPPTIIVPLDLDVFARPGRGESGRACGDVLVRRSRAYVGSRPLGDGAERLWDEVLLIPVSHHSLCHVVTKHT